MTLSQFYKHLELSRDTFRWGMSDAPIFEAKSLPKRIRAINLPGERYLNHCPLTGVNYVMSNVDNNLSDWPLAARILGLSEEHAKLIASAADGYNHGKNGTNGVHAPMTPQQRRVRHFMRKALSL